MPRNGTLNRERKAFREAFVRLGAPTWENSRVANSPRNRIRSPKEPAKVPESWEGYKGTGAMVVGFCGNPACDNRSADILSRCVNGKLICKDCSWDQDSGEIDFDHMEAIANDFK